MLDTRSGDVTVDLRQPVEGELVLRLSTVWDAGTSGSLCVNGVRVKTIGSGVEQDFDLSTADYRDWYMCEWMSGGVVYTRMLRVNYESKPVVPYVEKATSADSTGILLDTRKGDLTIDLSEPLEGERVVRLSTVWDAASSGSLCVNGVKRRTLGADAETDFNLSVADCIDRCFCEWTVGGRTYTRMIRPVYRSAPANPGKTSGVSAALRLDTMQGVRNIADYWGYLTYDAEWYDGVSALRVQECSEVLAEGVRGQLAFSRSVCGYNFALCSVDANGQQCVCETAQFAGGEGDCVGAVTKEAVEPTSSTPGSVAELTCIHCGKIVQSATVIPALGYVRNVSARRIWPYSKVEVCYEIADDIGEAVDLGSSLVLTASYLYATTTKTAVHVLGDIGCSPGGIASCGIWGQMDFGSTVRT